MDHTDPQVLATIRSARTQWEGMTGLRTYSIPWVRAGEFDLFDSELPWRDQEEAAVQQVLDVTSDRLGIDLVLERRNTRMTVSLPTPPPQKENTP